MSKYDIRITVDTPDNVGGLRAHLQYGKNIKITEERYASNFNNCSHNRRDYANAKENKMKRLDADLKEITNYLIQFFYKTNKEHSCTQTKLGKMLSALAFKYARKNILLFDETIYKYPPHCGTLIKALTFIPKDIYIRDLSAQDNNTEIDIDSILDDVKIPPQYMLDEDIPMSIKIELRLLFLRFGAFSGNELAKFLNPIVDQIVQETNNELDISKLANMKMSQFKTNETNDLIVNYIYED